MARLPYPLRARLSRLPAQSRQPVQITALEVVLPARRSGRRKPRKLSRTLRSQNSHTVSSRMGNLLIDASSTSGLRLAVSRRPVSIQLAQIGPCGPDTRCCWGPGLRPQKRQGAPLELPFITFD